MVTTVIFDLDDTLYDEIDYCSSGFTAVADFISKLPQKPSSEHIFQALWIQFTSGNHTKTFDAAFDKLGIEYNDEFIASAVKTYREHLPKIALPDDSKEVLSQLCDKYTLALLTDGFLPAQRLKVQALGIEYYFKCIIYTEELGRDCWKPSTAGFEKLIQELNIKPETAVYIADNEKKDFIAPNRLGLGTIKLTRPAGIHTESSAETSAKARYVINKITLLPQILKNIQ